MQYYPTALCMRAPDGVMAFGLWLVDLMPCRKPPALLLYVLPLTTPLPHTACPLRTRTPTATTTRARIAILLAILTRLRVLTMVTTARVASRIWTLWFLCRGVSRFATFVRVPAAWRSFVGLYALPRRMPFFLRDILRCALRICRAACRLQRAIAAARALRAVFTAGRYYARCRGSPRTCRAYWRAPSWRAHMYRYRAALRSPLLLAYAMRTFVCAVAPRACAARARAARVPTRALPPLPCSARTRCMALRFARIPCMGISYRSTTATLPYCASISAAAAFIRALWRSAPLLRAPQGVRLPLDTTFTTVYVDGCLLRAAPLYATHAVATTTFTPCVLPG